MKESSRFNAFWIVHFWLVPLYYGIIGNDLVSSLFFKVGFFFQVCKPFICFHLLVAVLPVQDFPTSSDGFLFFSCGLLVLEWN